MPELRESIHATGPGQFGVAERGIIALVDESRLRRILSRMLDENEFLSPYGIRALSRYHAEHPYVFSAQGQGIAHRVIYLPAVSSGHRHVRRQLELARADRDAGRVNVMQNRALLQYY